MYHLCWSLYGRMRPQGGLLQSPKRAQARRKQSNKALEQVAGAMALEWVTNQQTIDATLMVSPDAHTIPMTSVWLAGRRCHEKHTFLHAYAITFLWMAMAFAWFREIRQGVRTAFVIQILYKKVSNGLCLWWAGLYPQHWLLHQSPCLHLAAYVQHHFDAERTMKRVAQLDATALGASSCS